MAFEVLPRVIRHRGTTVDRHRMKHRMAERGFTTVTLAKRSEVSRWVISRALNGHPIDHISLQKIAECLAATPVVDGGLAAVPKPEET